MKIITINLPEKYLDAIKSLNEYFPDKYPSRSEAIRIALRDFLADELEMYKQLNNENFKMLLRSSKSATIIR